MQKTGHRFLLPEAMAHGSCVLSDAYSFEQRGNIQYKHSYIEMLFSPMWLEDFYHTPCESRSGCRKMSFLVVTNI
jgi:hypothetical protein